MRAYGDSKISNIVDFDGFFVAPYVIEQIVHNVNGLVPDQFVIFLIFARRARATMSTR